MAKSTLRYHPSPTFEEELEKADETKAAQMERAQAAAQAARRFVPRGRGREVRTYYAYFDGKEVMLMTTSSFWHFIEYGTRNNPPYAPLRKGVEAAGCKFTDPRAGK